MNNEIKDRQIKIVALTDYLIELPSSKHTIVYTLVLSAIAGIIGNLFIQSQLTFSMIVHGIGMGFFFLGIPAVLSGFLTALATRFMGNIKLQLHRSLYLSFFSTAILSALYLVAGIFGNKNALLIIDFLIYGYVLIFLIRAFVLSVTYPYKGYDNIILAAIHPVIGYLFLANSNALGLVIPIFPIKGIDTITLLLKTGISLSVLLVGILLFILLINAPMKRNFGVKSFQLAKVFISHWYHNSMEIEGVLKGMSEKADSIIGLIAFKAKNKIKALLVVPYIHPGPFGGVGGGKLARIFVDELSNVAELPIIQHGTATHDLNPVTTESLYVCINAIKKTLPEIKFGKNATKSIRLSNDGIQFFGQRFNESTYMATTFSPEATEDIDLAIGLAVMRELGKNSIYVDAHNCFKEGHHTVFSGSKRMFKLIDGAQAFKNEIEKQKCFTIKAGTSTDSMPEFTEQQGIGAGGIRTLIIEVGGQKTAYVTIGGNNIIAGLREKIIDEVKKLDIDEAEIFSTDSHAVNSIRGGQNPLGQIVDPNIIIERVVKTTKQAMENLEPVEVGTAITFVRDLDVLGPQKATQLITTANSMIAIMKFMAPIIFIFGMVFSLLGVLLIQW